MVPSAQQSLRRSAGRPSEAFLVAVALAAIVSLASRAVADDSGATVVARVGDETITAEEVSARIDRSPPHQLASLGDDREAIARAVVEKMVEPRLMAKAARADGLDERPEVRDRIRSVLSSALIQKLRKEAGREAVSDEKVRAYYEEHRERYASEERIRVWQITVSSRKEAEELIDHVRNDAGFAEEPVKSWEKLARERSIDKSTRMRRGDLGFVAPDGSTKHADVTLPPAVYEAAAKVGEGEVVPEPVKIGEHWMVVQNRGELTTPERSFESVAPTIRARLTRKAMKDRVDALVEKLRAEHLEQYHPELVDRIEIGSEGQISPRPRPGTLRKSREPATTAKPVGPPGKMR